MPATGLFRKANIFLQLFIVCKQLEGEKVSLFATRLEDLLDRAVQVGNGHTDSQNEMLVSALRVGISTNLKVLAGYKFDKYTDFDAMLVELRRVEDEMADGARPCSLVNATAAKPLSNDTPKDEMSKLTGMVHQMQKDVSELSRKISAPEGTNQQKQHDFDAGRPYGHKGQGRGRGRGAMMASSGSLRRVGNLVLVRCPLMTHSIRMSHNMRLTILFVIGCGQVGHSCYRVAGHLDLFAALREVV